MDLAAHSILDPSGKLLAVCPDKEIAREIAETNDQDSTGNQGI